MALRLLQKRDCINHVQYRSIIVFRAQMRFIVHAQFNGLLKVLNQVKEIMSAWWLDIHNDQHHILLHKKIFSHPWNSLKFKIWRGTQKNSLVYEYAWDVCGSSMWWFPRRHRSSMVNLYSNSPSTVQLWFTVNYETRREGSSKDWCN